MSRIARSLHVNWRYAVGEIAIIVVGILIALAFDSCYDRRISNQRESDYLARVAADVQRDTAAFTFTDSLLDAKEKALAAADSVFSGGGALRDTVALLQALVAGSNLGWNQPRVRPITFHDLLSTGNLRLIRNLELRGEIVQYYTGADGIYGRIVNRVTGYAPLTYKLLPRESEFVYGGPAHGPALAAITASVFASDLRSHLIAERNFARFMRAQNAVLRQNAMELLKRIDQDSRRSRSVLALRRAAHLGR